MMCSLSSAGFIGILMFMICLLLIMILELSFYSLFIRISFDALYPFVIVCILLFQVEILA